MRSGEFADRDLGNKRDVSWLLSPTVPSVRPDLSRDFNAFLYPATAPGSALLKPRDGLCVNHPQPAPAKEAEAGRAKALQIAGTCWAKETASKAAAQA